MESGCLCCTDNIEQHKKYVIRLNNLKYENERALKKSLEKNYGICDVSINLFEGLLTVNYSPQKITLNEIKHALILPNFLLEKTVKRWAGSLFEKYGKHIRLVTSVVFVVLSWILLFTMKESYTFPDYFYLTINTIAIVIAGFPTFKAAFSSLKHRHLNVHVLIALAATSAVAIGDWLEAATVLLITVIGEFLEGTSLKKSKKDIFSILMLGTRDALVRDENGKIVEIPVHKVRKGQTIVVRQGMKIPVDGIVKKGNVQVNESHITGESTFNEKNIGDKVYAGSILEYGLLEMEGVSTAGDTALAQVAKLVEKARHEKTDSEKTVDKFARYVIPVILALSLVVLFGNVLFKITFFEAVERSLTILVVACPCALVLATPTAVNAGVARAARMGILFKNGNIMEILAKVKILFMDKTGTVTYARPSVVELKTFQNYTEQEVLEAAAFVEQKSMHPLAKAISNYCTDRSIKVEEPDKFLEFEGGGAGAVKGNKHIKVGALWLMEDGRELPEDVLAWIKKAEEQGSTCVIVANKKDIMGAFRIEDQIREDAISTLNDLRAEGIQKILMVTGDNARVAAHVSKYLGVDEYTADCMPDTKIKKIKAEKEKGEIVAMIGDGINDAPALAIADVGISMGAIGSEAAVEAGDVSLMNDNISGLTTAIRNSKMVLHAIKLNIFFAVTFNLLAVLFASVGKIDMLMGALLHQVSALVVIFNSMLLFIRKK